MGYENLRKQNLLVEMTGQVENTRDGHDTKRHYVAPSGISSVIKYFIGDTRIDYNRRVSSINKIRSSWAVMDTKKKVEQFDAVILSIPAAQVLGIEGNFHQILNSGPFGEKLKMVQFSSRWAAGIYYP